MKKFISIMLCVCICLSSTVFCFADFTSTDSTTLSNIYKYMPTFSQITTMNNTLSTISTKLLNIYNDVHSALFDSNHGVAYWVHAIDTFMSPILSAITAVPTDLESIKGLLSKVDIVNGVQTYDPYLGMLAKGLTNFYAGTTHDRAQSSLNNHNSLLYNYDGTYRLRSLNTNDYGALWSQFNWYSGSPIGNIALILKYFNDNVATSMEGVVYQAKSTQSFTEWDTLNSSSFTPSSMATGLYTWLSKIQTPTARLSYVLASDERIEAQEKAAENEQAVVDNFIDSSGSGAASTSDFGSVSDLSSGFKNNISTNASVSGIWNIFNSDNFGWFSQETADQLDTTGSGNRTLRSSGSYPTPLLDQQTEDILKYIGGDDND